MKEPPLLRRIEVNGRSVRCRTRKRFAVAVPANTGPDRLHVTLVTDDEVVVADEVRRLARTRLATTVVYVFRLTEAGVGSCVTFDEDDLARIAIKEDQR